MATSTKASLATTGVAVLLMLVAAAVPASSSTVTLFEETGCTGNTLNDWDCNVCHNITFKGGYDFVYVSPGTLFLYDEPDCAKDSLSATIDKDTWHCSGITQQSMSLACSETPNHVGKHAAAKGKVIRQYGEKRYNE